MINKKNSLLLAMCMLILGACAEEVATVEQPLRPVRYIQAQSSGAERALTFAGVTRAGFVSRLSFKVSGTLKEKYIKVGDEVRKSQLLFELDPKDLQVSMQQYQAGLASAQAAERNAISNYERVRLLYENNNASLNDLETARANADSVKANVRATEKQLENARNQLQYTKLYAPNDCAVATINVDKGENINAAQQVAQLNCGDEPEVEITLPETYISRVHPGNKAVVAFDARPGVTNQAKVTEVGIASTAGAAFPVIVKLDKNDDGIRAGMAAEVLLFLSGYESDQTVIYVPSNAVGEDRQGRFIWIVESAEESGVGVIRRRNVVIGKLTENGLEIGQGLQGGEYVVTAGTTFLAEGMKVSFSGS